MTLTLAQYGNPVSLAKLEPGSLFFFENTLCVKSEYRAGNGAIEAIIVGTGEAFWGGTTNPTEQVCLKVQPVSVVNGSNRASINSLVTAAHLNAISKGWHDSSRSFAEEIALIHSEASEALEDFRAGKHPTEVWYEKKVYHSENEFSTRVEYLPIAPDWKPCGIPSELADIVIRVFDTCGRYGIDLEESIREKMAYNATRPIRHGGKRL